jgi:protoheme ferro-lyase
MKDDEKFLQGVKPYLSNAFGMTNINFIKFCFKIKVSKNITNHSLRLSQKQYLAYVLKHFGMLNVNLLMLLYQLEKNS